jgi:23S rRNA (cytidine1920-2'-O)/16S rRNA (cytidine1409-2'-O)-methyltransferase
MYKQRLDQALVQLGLVSTRSQAESYIKLAQVTVNGKINTKAGTLVRDEDSVKISTIQQYVSRAALKLASVAEALDLDFVGKLVLDVGSSTGGFTDYALRNHAKKVIAVEVGTGQLHPTLVGHPLIELHEKTNILEVGSSNLEFRSDPKNIPNSKFQIPIPDIVLVDVSFTSTRDLLPHIVSLINKNTQLVVMVKPQFEAAKSSYKHNGVIKNDKMRRDILKDFETWAVKTFKIINKVDSEISGAKGNKERFYLLRKV